ncbi:PREDICTED: collagen alpha-1(XVII) chain-like, partial [Condylura cristata]|uniref:collagen alpha-1(XVII) chain-like n=1 Tax=Condylura cristata TaxID=143302 RepID=UPI000643931A
SEDDCLPEYRHLFSPDLLQDKVAFVTGGGSGIGFRIAEIFMRHGCHTVIASRSLPRVSVAARKLAAATGQRCLPLSLDVRAPLAVMAAVDQALKEFGKIDILVNCESPPSEARGLVATPDSKRTLLNSRGEKIPAAEWASRPASLQDPPLELAEGLALHPPPHACSGHSAAAGYHPFHDWGALSLDGDGDGLVRTEDFVQFATVYGAEQVSGASSCHRHPPPAPRRLYGRRIRTPAGWGAQGLAGSPLPAGGQAGSRAACSEQRWAAPGTRALRMRLVAGGWGGPRTSLPAGAPAEAGLGGGEQARSTPAASAVCREGPRPALLLRWPDQPLALKRLLAEEHQRHPPAGTPGFPGKGPLSRVPVSGPAPSSRLGVEGPSPMGPRPEARLILTASEQPVRPPGRLERHPSAAPGDRLQSWELVLKRAGQPPPTAPPSARGTVGSSHRQVLQTWRRAKLSSGVTCPRCRPAYAQAPPSPRRPQGAPWVPCGQWPRRGGQRSGFWHRKALLDTERRWLPGPCRSRATWSAERDAVPGLRGRHGVASARCGLAGGGRPLASGGKLQLRRHLDALSWALLTAAVGQPGPVQQPQPRPRSR